MVRDKLLKLCKCAGTQNVADALTKSPDQEPAGTILHQAQQVPFRFAHPLRGFLRQHWRFRGDLGWSGLDSAAVRMRRRCHLKWIGASSSSGECHGVPLIRG
eukprot:2000180-Rhodomonas_salina.1